MKLVYVSCLLEAFHKWEKAPKEVSFLKNLHRHLFGIKLGVEVKGDREIEFFMLKWRLEKFLKKYEKKEIKSCEWLAERILEWAKKKYGKNRFYVVEVNEDEENGVILTSDNRA